MQAEEKRVKLIQAQWTARASKKINSRTNIENRHISNLCSRYEDGIINTSELLTGLSIIIGTNMKYKKLLDFFKYFFSLDFINVFIQTFKHNEY